MRNGYVGEKAASDEDYVSSLFERLLTDWQAGTIGVIE